MSRSSRTRRLSAGLAVAALAFTATGTVTAAQAVPVSPAGSSASAAEPGPLMNYVVNTHADNGHVKKAEQAIEAAGGTVVQSYDRLGVVIAQSTNPDFRADVRAGKNGRDIQSVGATRTAPVSEGPVGTAGKVAAAKGLNAGEATPAPDPREVDQWDMVQIKADQAHKVTDGSRRILVGVNDSGVDDTHPDLAPNFDVKASANCVSGKPDTTPGSWRPNPGESDHGTHVAGTIAAAKNGVGITGVAPGVKVSGIKVSTPDGFFYTEAVVCGFVWAAEHGVDITNNSYYTDPWMFACKTDEDQKALVEAVTRATRYAEKKGTVNVAAAGNSKFDLAADEIVDNSSPNDTTPGDRVIDPSECFDYPAQLPGVVTVSATGAKDLKASYSNYGLGVIDIAAPGGDRTEYQTPDAPAVNGRILSTTVNGGYNYKAGTSMASPHAAGVLALLKSTHPYASPAALKALLYAQADERSCTNPYDIEGDGKIDAVCEGGKQKNGFYGAGLVDALDAVRKW